MQLGTITEAPFRQFSKTFWVFVISTFVGSMLTRMNVPWFSEKWYYSTMAVCLGINYLMFGIKVATGMADTLGISIFTIPKQK